MNEAQTRTACLLLGEPRAEMRGDAGRAKAVVQNRLDDDVVALNVVVDGEREVRNHHAVMTEVDGVYACEINEGIERGGDVLHEVVKYPCAIGGIEVLSLGEVELGKSRKSHAFHVTARPGGPRGGLSRPSSRRRESCRRRRDVRGGQALVRAIPAARKHWKPLQVTTKDSPSPELSARHPSRRFFALQLACSISPFAVIIAKKAGAWKVVFE